MRQPVLQLGRHAFDLEARAVVIGILNRTRDSFSDGGRHFTLDALLRGADGLVHDGADVLEIGGRAGGVGTEEVSVAEEVERVVTAVGAVRERFDAPLAVDTWRAPVAAEALRAGAVLANDMSGLVDPDYLTTVVQARAAVVVTHHRTAPGIPDPDPCYGDVVADVRAALDGLAREALSAGVLPDRLILDPGLDLGKTWQQSLRLLDALDAFAALGFPVLLAASNKLFLRRALGLPRDRLEHANVAAASLAIVRGARLLRVHDARAARHAADLLVPVLRERRAAAAAPPPWERAVAATARAG